MALYELDKRGQARKHIYDQKGGIKAGDIDLGTSLKENDCCRSACAETNLSELRKQT